MILHEVGRGVFLFAIAPGATADAEPGVAFWAHFGLRPKPVILDSNAFKYNIFLLPVSERFTNPLITYLFPMLPGFQEYGLQPTSAADPGNGSWRNCLSRDYRFPWDQPSQ